MPLWVNSVPGYKGSETDEKTHEKIVKFCNKYIITPFPLFDEDAELYNTIKEVQTPSRNHSKSCLKYHNTIYRFGRSRPVSHRTFIYERIKVDNDDDKQRLKKNKKNSY